MGATAFSRRPQAATQPAPDRRLEPSLLLYESLPQLSGVPDILAGLSAEERRQVEAAGQRLLCPAGKTIFAQGQEHDGIFIIQSGIARVFYVAPNGREITLAYWTPGNFIGGPEMFGGGVHVWTGIATEPCEVLHLSGAVVRRLTRDIPAFALGVIEGLTFKGKCYTALVQMLGTRSVLERLAHLLVNLGESRGVVVEGRQLIVPSPSHEDLAAMVGATRQWVTNALDRFRQQKLIELRRRQIVILDAEGLIDLAHGG